MTTTPTDGAISEILKRHDVYTDLKTYEQHTAVTTGLSIYSPTVLSELSDLIAAREAAAREEFATDIASFLTKEWSDYSKKEKDIRGRISDESISDCQLAMEVIESVGNEVDRLLADLKKGA